MKEGGGEGIYDFYLKKKKQKKGKKKTFSNKNHSSPTHWPPNCKGDEHQEDSRRGGVGAVGACFRRTFIYELFRVFSYGSACPTHPQNCQGCRQGNRYIYILKSLTRDFSRTLSYGLPRGAGRARGLGLPKSCSLDSTEGVRPGHRQRPTQNRHLFLSLEKSLSNVILQMSLITCVANFGWLIYIFFLPFSQDGFSLGTNL